MKRGRRGKILFDSIDVDIMRKLKKKSLGVMELRKAMQLEHKNLKAHLNRLSDIKLIEKSPVPRSRKIMLSVPKKKRVSSVFRTFSK